MISALGLAALVGCGGSTSSTILSGSVSGASGTTSGLVVSAKSSTESFDEQKELESAGSFRFTKVPDGLVEVSVTRSGESTGIDFDVEVASGKTSTVELYLMTWSPEPIGELQMKEAGASSMSSVRPVGPSGTTMSTNSDGDRVYETPKGLVVTRKSDGDVVVDDSAYTP